MRNRKKEEMINVKIELKDEIKTKEDAIKRLKEFKPENVFELFNLSADLRSMNVCIPVGISSLLTVDKRELDIEDLERIIMNLIFIDDEQGFLCPVSFDDESISREIDHSEYRVVECNFLDYVTFLRTHIPKAEYMLFLLDGTYKCLPIVPLYDIVKIVKEIIEDIKGE